MRTFAAAGKDDYRPSEGADLSESELRQMALGIAMELKADGARVADVLAEAERVLSWLCVAPTRPELRRPN